MFNWIKTIFKSDTPPTTNISIKRPVKPASNYVIVEVIPGKYAIKNIIENTYLEDSSSDNWHDKNSKQFEYCMSHGIHKLSERLTIIRIKKEREDRILSDDEIELIKIQ